MKKCLQWRLCSLCSGDGVANMVADEDGNVEEGICPQCNGTGWIQSTGYMEIDEDWLKEQIIEAISMHPEWFETRVVQAFTDNITTLRDAFKQWMREVLAE